MTIKLVGTGKIIEIINVKIISLCELGKNFILESSQRSVLIEKYFTRLEGTEKQKWTSKTSISKIYVDNQLYLKLIDGKWEVVGW